MRQFLPKISTFTPRIIIVFMALMVSKPLMAQNPSVSLLTCEAGDEVYSVFGHNAIRIQDSISGDDIYFDYGSFDFDAPGFIPNFMKGKLNYSMGAGRMRDFVFRYDHDKRTVREQKLNITDEEANAIYQFLKNNYRPENRKFLYDFYFDNCSTRLRDLFENVLNITYHDTVTNPLSHRNLIDLYLKNWPWMDFGVDLIIGSKSDRPTSFREQMFLPNTLHDGMTHAVNSRNEPLMNTSETIIDHLSVDRSASRWWRPFWVFFALLVMEIFLFTKSYLAIRLYDKLWYITISVVSAILLFMWFGTDHEVCSSNWNILWANPLFFLLLRTKKDPNRTYLIWALVSFLVVAIIVGLFGIQAFHTASYLIIGILIIKLLRQLTDTQRYTGLHN